MTQAGRILASYRKIMVTLEARNPLACILVEDAAHSDRPVAEFVENALHCAELPQRIHVVGGRIGARGCTLGTRARQWNRVAFRRKLWLLRIGGRRPPPRQLSDCFFTRQHGQRPDRKNRRWM